ncbi:MAG: trypsin-like peptidase domain-containing protein [Chloroflexi bacterium]|nr:trypsin-like peptidase domain-containing protein [Chloroflexota bacterium]
MSRNNRKRCFLALLSLIVAFALPDPAAQAEYTTATPLADYTIPGGHFYTQASGAPGRTVGFSLTDEAGIPFWSEFQRLGGVPILGYPASRRFQWDGFWCQATQKVIMQWRPEAGQVYFINVLNQLSRAGRDDWLLSARMTPKPMDMSEESNLTWAQIVQRRYALLEPYPAIKAHFFSTPDPLHMNGLPTAPVADMGNAYVLRAQRTIIQQWKVAVPWSKAGQTTTANGGDLAKEAGLLPPTAILPEESPLLITSSPQPQPDEATTSTIQKLVADIQPAVVKVMAEGSGRGSGIILDKRGCILTNYHVIQNNPNPTVTLVDGRRFDARIMYADPWTDLALLKIGAADLTTLPLGDSAALQVGQWVVALGYTPSLPRAPSVSLGRVSALNKTVILPEGTLPYTFIQHDAPIYPGHSGGPLLNLQGQVVGINTAVVTRKGIPLSGHSLSIASNGVRPIIEQLLGRP